MSGRGLPVIKEPALSKKQQFEEKTQKKWELAWKEEREKYDPFSSFLEQERLKRTYGLIAGLDLKEKEVIDLGCGNGALLSLIQGEKMTGLDVADEALKYCPSSINKIRGCLPYCSLPEQSYDLVILADVLAEIESSLYRSLLSECATLLNTGGHFLCSTPLDFRTLDPLGHFLALLKTEFEVVAIKKSYHRLYTHLRKWISPSPILERLSEMIWAEGGMTHAIVLCKRKRISI